MDSQKPIVLRYPFDPNTISRKIEPPIIEDLKSLTTANKYACLVALQKMIFDLKQNAHESRYLRTLHEYPAVLELKNASRGGEAGGARVYLYRAAEHEYHLCAAECKTDSRADLALLERTAMIAFAWKKGIPIFKEVI